MPIRTIGYTLVLTISYSTTQKRTHAAPAHLLFRTRTMKFWILNFDFTLLIVSVSVDLLDSDKIVHLTIGWKFSYFNSMSALILRHVKSCLTPEFGRRFPVCSPSIFLEALERVKSIERNDHDSSSNLREVVALSALFLEIAFKWPDLWRVSVFDIRNKQDERCVIKKNFLESYSVVVAVIPLWCYKERAPVLLPAAANDAYLYNFFVHRMWFIRRSKLSITVFT